MFASSVLARGKAALQGSEPEQKLAHLLHDETVHVISSFELNQIASLTYGDLVCDILFEILQDALSKPASYSPLTLQKALVVTKHVLIFGAASVVNSAIALGKHVESLQTYNTVLLAQQQQGAAGMLYRLKGGGVDKGGPVREAAAALLPLLENQGTLRHERQTQADPNSLVPVGDSNQIAFCSDEVRLLALKRRMEQQLNMQIKSNLVKAHDGFGGGYNSRDGKAVVGAAHGLDEMMKQAQREQQRFSDDGTGRGYTAPLPELSFALQQHPQPQSQQQQQQPDLLLGGADAAAPVPEIDLLDFATDAGSGACAGDFLGGATGDFFGAMAHGTTTATITEHVDIFASSSSSYPQSNTAAAAAATAVTTADLLSTMTLTTANVSVIPSSSTENTKPAPGNAVMRMAMSASAGPAQDRFAALDALQPAGGNPLSSLEAENRIVSMNHPSNSLSELAGLGMGQFSSTTTGNAPTPSYATLSSLKVNSRMAAPTFPAASSYNGDQDENGFVMGGTVGAGLEPTAAAPAAAPPPPPPPPPTTSGLW